MTTYELTFIVPTPTVIATAPHSQIVGQSLTLQCEVTTVRGITSRVDIVWSSNDILLRRINDTIATTMDNSLVYTDSYIVTMLSTSYNGRIIECEIIINVNPPIMATDNFTLSVDGEYYNVHSTMIYYVITFSS